MSLSEVAQSVRRRFEDDLEALGFLREGGSFVGTLMTAAGARRVRILLDEGFPYHKPTVIPLDPAFVEGHPHQAPWDGSMCLWPDEGSGWDPAMTAEDLLERASAWCEHVVRNDWSEADQAPDAHRLFATEPGSGFHRLIVTDVDWPPPRDATWGHCGVWRPTSAGAYPALIARPTTGVRLPSLAQVPKTAGTLFLGDPTASVAVWVRLTAQPKPLARFGPFLDEVDRLRQAGVPSLRTLVPNQVGRHAASRRDLLIGLGYPDPDGRGERWLFVGTQVPRGASARTIADSVVYALETAPGDEVALRRRLPPWAHALHAARVSVFGVGALGSMSALSLAKSGVGTIDLFDGDRLRPGHVLRHAAPMFLVGRRKVQATQAAISYAAPAVVVNAETTTTWRPAELRPRIAESGLVIDATATPSFSLLLNEMCNATKAPLLTQVAFRAAGVGRVRLVRAGQDACVQCLATDEPDPAWTVPIVPVMAGTEFFEVGCGEPTSVAAAADLEAISNVATRMALRVLSDDWDDRNQAIIVNRAIQDASPLLRAEGVHFATNRPRSSCPVCG